MGIYAQVLYKALHIVLFWLGIFAFGCVFNFILIGIQLYFRERRLNKEMNYWINRTNERSRQWREKMKNWDRTKQ